MLYGDDNEVWSKYINNAVNKELSFKDVFDNIKNIDMESIQKGVENMQKTIGLLQGLSLGGTNGMIDKGYIPKDNYHHMED